MVTETMVKDFVERCQNEVMIHVNNDEKTWDNDLYYNLTYKIGRRYSKIISRNSSVWGFIDMQTGAILKAASWAAPAKNFSRGNIFNLPEDLGKRYYWTGIS